MTSLFQGFAEDQKLRQAERAAQIKAALQSKQQRQKELRSQAESMDQLLTSTNQARLLSNRHRLIVANLHQKSRNSDANARSQGVAEQLAQQSNLRQANAQADRQARQQAFSQRARAVEQFLRQLHQHRLTASSANQQSRLEERHTRRHSLQQQLRQVRLHRLHSSDLAKSLRQQQQSALSTTTRQLLSKLQSDRLRQTSTLRQSLTDFRRHLAQQVGAVSQVRPMARPKALAPAKPVPPEPVPIGTPEQFIRQYLSQLPHQPSLEQVVGDRDRVRDILAQGANQLKVDPSDILSTLLRMASMA